MKELREILHKLIKHPDSKHSFYAFYPASIWKQHSLWCKYLPKIKPYYAIKSNPEPLLIKRLYWEGVNFDCASLQELSLVKKTLYTTDNIQDNIIYANPCKSHIDLSYANNEVNSPTTVVDSFEEVDKLDEVNYKGGALVRILVDDKNSKMPFSGKFGIDPSKVKELGNYALKKNINIKGISFHVGSGGNDGKVYYNTIQIAKNLCNTLQEQTHSADIIDIGGGFLSDEFDFKKKANFINGAFDPNFKFIAEPGRFFSSVCQDFFVKVIGKKPWNDGWRYTIDDSLYGQFSCIPFDQASPTWLRVPACDSDMDVRPKTRGLLMGRTCDSVDVIARSECMEALEVGDWLWFPNMGSYTNATANEFNGFPKPHALEVFINPPDINNCEFMDRVPNDVQTMNYLNSSHLLK